MSGKYHQTRSMLDALQRKIMLRAHQPFSSRDIGGVCTVCRACPLQLIRKGDAEKCSTRTIRKDSGKGGTNGGRTFAERHR